jgi:hypothetical protein
MSQITKVSHAVLSENMSLPAAAVSVVPYELDVEDAIGVFVQAAYTFTTAPGTSKSIFFFTRFSQDGTNYDTPAKETAGVVAAFPLANATDQQVVSFQAGADTCGARRMKIAVYHDASVSGVLNWVKATVKKAVN